MFGVERINLDNADRLLCSGALITLLVASGCGRSESEVENTKLRSELEQVKSQLKDIQTQLKQETAQKSEDEARRRRDLSDAEQAKQKLAATESERKAKADQEAQNSIAVEKCFEKIALRMKSLLNTPIDYSYQTEAERRQTETKLKTLATGKKEEIGEIFIELKSLGIATADLQNLVNAFFDDFSQIVFYKRVSADYFVFDRKEAGSQASKAEAYSSQAYTRLSLLYEAQRILQKRGKVESGEVVK